MEDLNEDNSEKTDKIATQKRTKYHEEDPRIEVLSQ